MDEQLSLIIWWRTEREQICSQLREKAKTEPLSEVETMILNPFTVEVARNQVDTLNRLVGVHRG